MTMKYIDSILSKIFERILLERLQEYIITTDSLVFKIHTAQNIIKPLSIIKAAIHQHDFSNNCGI